MPNGERRRHINASRARQSTAPVPHSCQLLRLALAANTSSVQLAPGMTYIDLGFIEPCVFVVLPRMAQ